MENIILTFPYKNNQHVAMIRLNRPKSLNAITTGMLKEIVISLEELEYTDVRTVILTGNEKAFAAGADIQKMAGSNPIQQFLDERMKLWKRFSLFSKPIIAAVDGYALGGGCELAMACDLIIAGDRAKFGQPEINLALIPGAGGTQRLVRAIGKAKAMHLVLTGELIKAQKALEYGIISKVVSSESLLDEVYELAKKIAEKSPVATRLAKEAINNSFESHLSAGLEFERKNFYMTFASKDQQEGIQAFLDKRPPNYQGR